MSSPLRIFRAFLIIAAIGLAAAPAMADPAGAGPAFAEAGPLTSDSGYFALRWHARQPVTLEIAGNGDFASARPLYRGRNTQLFLSGLGDGEYSLRLRGEDNSLSDPLRLTVRHQSLTRALLLVALGALAFLATLAVVLRGARDE